MGNKKAPPSPQKVDLSEDGKTAVLNETELKTPSTLRWLGAASLLLLLISFLGLLFSMTSPSEPLISGAANHASGSFPPLLTLDDFPALEDSFVPEIFLFWTTPVQTFQPRNKLVLESYLFHHPAARITIYATHLTAETDFADLVTSGYHLRVIRLNDTALASIGKNCPGREWLETPAWKSGRYYYSHLTDFLRFCLLFSEGGIYSDFDAILLNPLPAFPNFIGRDEAGKNRNCGWCFPGGTGYLAPGLMAASKGSQLTKAALTIGFESGYDPEVFNLVGPQAITKAYKVHPEGVEVLDSHQLYPFKYWEVEALFKGGENHSSQALSALTYEKLRRRSLSLHLYGHVSSKLPIEPNSVVDVVARALTLTPSGVWALTGPEYVGIRREIQRIAACRVIPEGGKPAPRLRELRISVDHGGIACAGMREFARELVFPSLTPREANEKLSALLFSRSHRRDQGEHGEAYEGKTRLRIEAMVACGDGEARCPRVSKEISLLDINFLVTVVSKTMDRMEKVFQLVRSVQQFYPNITLLVADDGEGAQSQSSGMKRGFSYHVLPHDLGLSAGRNFLLGLVRTKYFLTVDDDFMFDEDSVIEDLLWELEADRCDLAAGKNPHDEKRYQFEFMGLINIVDQDLRLDPGSHEAWGSCHRVDIVPNLFVAPTELIRTTLPWDPQLKLGEHEDFFLRAKQQGVRVCSCATTSFQHHPSNWGEKKTTYDKMRHRIFQFWKLSLEKHHLKRLISFDNLMTDISTPPPPSDLEVSDVFDTVLVMRWGVAPGVTHSKVLVSEFGKNRFTPMSLGGPEGTTTETTVIPTGLIPGMKYTFLVFAGNHYEFENRGSQVDAQMLSAKNAEGLLKNGDFEFGTNHWVGSVGTIFSTVGERFHGGQLCGRIHIPISNYQSNRPATMYISQTVSVNSAAKGFVLAAFSMVEQLFGDGSDVDYRIELQVLFKDGSKFVWDERFSTHVRAWQYRSFTVNLAPFVVVDKVTVYCILGALRGAVYFDDVRLLKLD